ncbi:thiol reductant ABC exporter subunit CydC [Algiphilus aromaticivorans]|uniref:thiol reductant ABC exporter subunit CydC n=1 Tax=Algiphilus aromaticivorans TaxID=382454 RepID=UPI0005C166F9|nr:thiol reductant ABC exporter subunit CydC [Algiphilus aromaticivorans]
MRPLRALLPYLALLRRRRGTALIGVLLLAATVASAVGLLGLSGWFITATGVTALAWAAGSRVVFDIFLPGAGIRFFALSRTVARYFERLWQHALTLDLLAALRTAVFARLAAQPAAVLARLRDAALLDRLTSDVDAIDNLPLRVAAPLATTALLVPTVAILLAWLATPWMLLPLGALSALTLGLGLLALRSGMRPGRRLRARSEALHARLLESLTGLAELHHAGSLNAHAARSRQLDARLAQAQRRRAQRLGALDAAMTTAVQLSAATALLLGLLLLDATPMGAAAAVLAALALLGLNELLPGLPQALYQLGETQTAAARLNQLLKGPGEAPAPAESMQEAAEAPALQLEGIGLWHAGRPTPALAEVSLTLARGERLAITGASGSGKSSLLQVIAGLQTADEGRMHVLGRPSETLHPAQLRDRMSVLTQHSEIFAASVADNLRLAAPEANEAALWRALHIAALDEVVAALPEGLDTWVGEAGARLSGGQTRRLALARVLLRDAPIVLLDEPATGLDAATRATVFSRLDAWLAGRSAIFLGHDAAVLPRADRSLQLYEGHIRATTTD